ncbi:MAG: serine/threonine-protein kinase [Gemmatimonadaceae bacterium]
MILADTNSMQDIVAGLHTLAGRYVIERELGRGATAVVYLALDQRHERHVAVKVLRPELSNALGGDRFLREIKLAAKLQHRQIVAVFDSGEAGGSLFYVMPFLNGESLRDRLTRERQLPIDDAIRIATQVAEALTYAHSEGIVHRDIKPENILLTGDGGAACVADFGIARAIQRAVGENHTGVGLAVGTPAYMSPEQASGDDLDGRSDIYSLGCVLYEMLVGMAPFVGATPQAVIAQRFSHRPAPVRVTRDRVPEWVDEAIGRAMARSPADRFATGKEFAQALAATSATGTRTASNAIAAPAAPSRARLWIALAAACVVAGAVIARLAPRSAYAGGDPTMFAVMPLRGAGASSMIDGVTAARLLHDGLSRWDVKLVSALNVQDALDRRGAKALPEKEARDLAVELNAGRVITGEIARMPNGETRITATLFSAAKGAVERTNQVTVRADSEIGRRFNDLADGLLVTRAKGSKADGEGALGTHVVAAAQSYAEGFAALGAWDLPQAEQQFAHASEVDPDFANAYLWQAQAMLLHAGGNVLGDSIKLATEQAKRLRDKLAPADRRRADALIALVEKRYPESCAQYAALVRGDATDLISWYGLGECRSRDKIVVRDRASPSGWRFRSSADSAAQAYKRALELVPSIHRAFRGEAFSRLPDLLYVTAHRLRSGYAAPPDTIVFAAYPALAGDTLAFVPYPMTQIAAAAPGTIPTTTSEAREHARLVLLEITRRWRAAFPKSPDALEQMATVLDAQGEASAAGQSDGTALESVRTARGLATEGAQRRRLAITEVRLLVKRSDFLAARTLADSLLAATASVPLSAVEAGDLAPLAALTGRLQRTSSLLVQSASDYRATLPNGREVTVPRSALEPALALLASCAVGAPADSLSAQVRRLDAVIQGLVAPAQRATVREALLWQPVDIAFPALREVNLPSEGGYVADMRRAALRHDRIKVRARYEELERQRAPLRPGDVAIDASLQEAAILLAVGDSAAAVERLDAALATLPVLQLSFDQPAAPGSLVRAMALRAELADHAGDRQTAARWARAVTVLWANADPALQPVVQRMRAISVPPRS